MKNSLRVLFVFILTSILSTFPINQIFAQTSMNLRVDLFTRYFYRGFDYNLGKPAFQPNFYFSHVSGFNVNVFTSFGLDKKTEFDEFDITLKYNYPLNEELTAFAGVNGIFFPNTESMPTNSGKFDYTYEFQTGLLYSEDAVSASFLYGHDFDNGDGDCIDINCSYSFSLSENLSLIPVLGGVYQTEYGISGSFNDKFTSVYLFLPLEIKYDKITLIPSYNISYIPSEKMRKVNELYNCGYKEFLQFAGFSVKYNF